MAMVAAAVSAMQSRGFSFYQRVDGVERAAVRQNAARVDAAVRAALGFSCLGWLLTVALPLANSGILLVSEQDWCRVASRVLPSAWLIMLCAAAALLSRAST